MNVVLVLVAYMCVCVFWQPQLVLVTARTHDGDGWVLDGQSVWIRADHLNSCNCVLSTLTSWSNSDVLLLLMLVNCCLITLQVNCMACIELDLEVVVIWVIEFCWQYMLQWHQQNYDHGLFWFIYCKQCISDFYLQIGMIIVYSFDSLSIIVADYKQILFLFMLIKTVSKYTLLFAHIK